jgi:hypothetical protein
MVPGASLAGLTPVDCDGRLANSGVDAVEQVADCDPQDQARKLPFVEVLRRRFPNVVAHRIGSIAQASHVLGEGQGGSLGLVEPGRLVPGSHAKYSLVGLTGRLGGRGPRGQE